MRPQISWLRNSRNQMLVIIIGLQLYLALGVILPAYERQPYYREKIAVLQNKHDKLNRQALHIDHYKRRKETTQAAIMAMKEELEHVKNPAYLQKHLNRLLISHQVNVISQQTVSDISYADFDVIEIKQSVSGSFTGLINYLDEIESLNPHLLIAQTHFINQFPLKADPSITLNLTIRTFSPKNI